MDKKFTDLLDEYLEAKADYDRERKNYTGYDFGYFFAPVVDRYREAEEELNKAFEAMKGTHAV